MTDSRAATNPGDYVSTAPTTSVLGGSGKSASGGPEKGRSKKDSKGHPWRDNIEAVAISIVTIVLFKYFVLEAYKIPTGSMQPTLMGNAETGIYDRVIVDKFSYHLRDPERFEIAVFKYPLNSAKNFIKRIIGMPGERMFIQGGDVWIQQEGEAEHVLRRPRPIQNAQLRQLETNGEWSLSKEAGTWKIDADEDGDTILASGPGSATYPGRFESISDGYLDGYPLGVKDKISEDKKRSGENDVTDLRVTGEVSVEAGTKSVAVVLHEGDRRFRFTLAGPGSTGGGKASGIEATGPGLPEGALQAEPTETIQLEAGKSYDVEVQNLNDLLELRVDGDLVCSLEVPPALSPNPARHVMESKVTLDVAGSGGAGAKFEDLTISRDIFYTIFSGMDPVTEWQIPEGSYVVLGDNSQDSSDGRDWQLGTFRVVSGENAGELIQGNLREMPMPHPESNPRYVVRKDGRREIFFTDQLGETRVLDQSNVQRLPDEHFSFVPRELIRGRAVLVVWPLAPQHDVYRWKWVR